MQAGFFILSRYPAENWISGKKNGRTSGQFSIRCKPNTWYYGPHSRRVPADPSASPNREAGAVAAPTWWICTIGGTYVCLHSYIVFPGVYILPRKPQSPTPSSHRYHFALIFYRIFSWYEEYLIKLERKTKTTFNFLLNSFHSVEL